MEFLVKIYEFPYCSRYVWNEKFSVQKPRSKDIRIIEGRVILIGEVAYPCNKGERNRRELTVSNTPQVRNK